jgi:deoxyribodipyrimidine photolyase
LGRDYPHPIVDHAMARRRAIAFYEEARASR